MVIEKTIESLKSVVSRILKRDERARNNYNWLVFQVWKELGYKIIIDYNLIETMPSFESISRVARTIQNDEQLFTPDDFTYDKRKKNCNESKEYYVNAQVNSQLSF